MSALGVEPVGLEELFRRSDFVSLHVPLTDQTRHMVGERMLALMKRSSVLINTSRGAVIDERALVRALKEKRLKSAGLDVLEKELPATENPLFDLSNVILTPRCAAHTPEATERARRVAVNTVISVFKNEQPASLVNPEVWRIRSFPSASAPF